MAYNPMSQTLRVGRKWVLGRHTAADVLVVESGCYRPLVADCWPRTLSKN